MHNLTYLLNAQLTEKEEKMKLEEGIRSVKAGVEAKIVEEQGVIEATEKQHSALVESEVLQSHRRRDLEAEVDARLKINIEQEEGARVKTKALLEGKSYVEIKVAEVDENKNLLEALVIKSVTQEDAGRRKVLDVEEKKKVAKEELSQVQGSVDQLREAATLRQLEIGALQHQTSDLEAVKTHQEQRKKHLQGDVEQLNKLSEHVEVALERKDAAEKQLGILKEIQQEKFGEEERRVVLQGQVQVAGEQVKQMKEELKVLESQVVFEEVNLQRLATESDIAEERKSDYCTRNEKLNKMVKENMEENDVLETRMKIMEEKVGIMKAEKKDLVELVDTLNREVLEALAKNENFEQQLASGEAEEAGEMEMIASVKCEKGNLAEVVKKLEEETERLKSAIHPKEEELITKKERSNALATRLNQIGEERRVCGENLGANSGRLNMVELLIQQMNSKAEELKICEAEVGRQLAEASSLLEQGERKQELRCEHSENMKKVKKLQKATKQAKSEATVVTKRKEKLERQLNKTRLETSKMKEEIDQAGVDIKTAREGIDELSAAAAADQKALLSRKEEIERLKTEVEERTNQSQELRSRAKVQKDEMKKSEVLLRKESGKVEEQKMMLEEKQRKGNAAVAQTEAECHDLEQTLFAANKHFEQSQDLKNQLMEKIVKVKEELGEVEKAISTASRQTPQQVGLFFASTGCFFFFF